MANNLSQVTPQLLAQGLLALRESSLMPRLVNSDYGNMAAQRGATIDVPIPSAITAQPVTPGPNNPTDADIAPTSVAINLDQWYEAPFVLTDKDILTAMDGTIPMQASEAIKSLSNQVDNHILSQYKGVYGISGTAGAAPFATDTSDATEARKVLTNQLAPLDSRRFVINPDAEANALNLRAFQDMSFSGSAAGILEGQINRKLGFDWFMDQNIPNHAAGSVTVNTAVTVTGVNAVGAASIGMTTGVGDAVALKAGDVITFSGDTQTYAVTADVNIGASATGAIGISPGKKVATGGGETVQTVTATHDVNLAFHRDAFAFATRPLAGVVDDGLGSVIMSQTDPVSGISLRLEVTRQHKQTRFSYDILWGAQLVRPELAVRCLG